MQIKKLNMTERTTNNGNTTTTTTTTARKHKKHKSSKHLMMDSSVDTGGSVASTSNSATVCSADGGFSSEVGPPPTNELAICCASSSTSSSAGTSTSTGLQSPKPLRIVLKMAQSGSYSPKLPLDNDDVGVDNAETTTTNTTINGTIDAVVNDVVNQSINYDGATNNNNVQLPLSMSMSQPPQLIPLNVDSFQNEFINSMKKSKKLKKTKKKHHHHHHHHHRAQQHNNDNNNFPNNNIGDDEGQSSSSSNFFLVPESSTSISVSSNSVQLPLRDGFNVEDSNVNTTAAAANHLLQFNHQSMSMNNGYVNQSQQQLKSSTTSTICSTGSDYLLHHRNGPEATTKIEIANSKNCQKPNPALLLLSSQNETTDVNINPIISSSSSSSSKYSQLQRNVTFSTTTTITTTANQSPPKNYSLYRRLLQNGTVKYHANNIGQQRPNYLRNSIYSTKHQQQSLKKLSQFQQFLHHLLDQLRAKDLQKFFAFPPSDLLEPGYSGVVQNPMDFNTMGKKIDYGLYESVYEMKFDCRVLCENALRYYPQSSVQYREAARLWHFAKTKVFHREAIAEVRRTLFPKLTNAEIGLESFSPISSTNNNPHATEGKLIKLELNSKSTLSNGINNNNEPRPLPQTALHALLTDVKIEPTSIEGRHQNGMKYHSEDVNNDEDYKLTPQQLFQNARKYLGNNANLEDANYHESKFTVDRPSGDHLSMLRQHSDGSTTLGLLSSLNGVDCDEISRLLLDDNSGSSVNIGRLVGKLNEGTTVLCPPYKEPEMYRIRPVQYFNDPLWLHQPGNNNNKPSVHRASFQYCSHLPFLDSSKATINLDDSSLLLNTFGDGIDGGEHQKAIDEVANNPDFMIPFVDSVLDIVSNGEYSKQAKISEDDVVPVEDELDDSTTTIDADETKELLTSNESAEVDRLKITESSEDNLCDAIVQQQLNEIDNLLQQLRTIQYRRLSKTTEPVSPDEREQEIAARISKQLVKLIGDCSVPGQIADVEAIHKAMGIVIEDDEDNSDLMQCFVEDNTTTSTTTQQQKKPLQEPEIVSMDLD